MPLFSIDTRDFENVNKFVEAVPAKIDKAFDLALRAFVPMLVAEIRANAAGRILMGHTMNLVKAVEFYYVTKNGHTEADILVDEVKAPYADILEEGGTIFEKGKWLKVPFRNSPTYPFHGDYSGFETAFTKKINDFTKVVFGRGLGGGLQGLYLLKRRVKEPETHWFSEPIVRKMPEFVSYFLDAMDAVMGKA